MTLSRVPLAFARRGAPLQLSASTPSSRRARLRPLSRVAAALAPDAPRRPQFNKKEWKSASEEAKDLLKSFLVREPSQPAA